MLISVPFPHHKSFLLSKCFDHTQTWTGDQQRFAIWETAIATATHYAAVARCVRAHFFIDMSMCFDIRRLFIHSLFASSRNRL